jgi:DNA-directed RNA polymerase specialized sigma24 family protein
LLISSVFYKYRSFFFELKKVLTTSVKNLLSSNPEDVNRAVIELYKQYFPGVSSYLSKYGLSEIDIQDVFQDGIITFLGMLRKGKIKENENVGGYLFTICKHAGFKKGKKNSTSSGLDIDISRLEQLPDALDPDMEEEETRNQLRLKSWKLMEPLGKSCGDLLKKAFSSDDKIAHFYAELGYKNAQVARTAKYKCLKRLKALLEKDPQAQQLIKRLFS